MIEAQRASEDLLTGLADAAGLWFEVRGQGLIVEAFVLVSTGFNGAECVKLGRGSDIASFSGFSGLGLYYLSRGLNILIKGPCVSPGAHDAGE